MKRAWLSIAFAAVCAAHAQSGSAVPGALAAVERSGAERRGVRRCAPLMDRRQERQLEGRDSRPRLFEPDRLVL